MTSYSKYLKERKQKDLEFFLGQEPKEVSNKYITFNHVIDNDNIIIATKNFKQYMSKDGSIKSLLLVGNDSAIYLKDWQYRICKCRNFGGDGYMVKINRKYFKPYKFSKSFEDMAFEQDQTFDDLKELAESQNDTAYHISIA